MYEPTSRERCFMRHPEKSTWSSVSLPISAMSKILEPYELVENYKRTNQDRNQAEKDDWVEHPFLNKKKSNEPFGVSEI